LKLVLVNFSRNLHSGKTEKRTVDRSVSQKNRTGSGLFYPIVKEQELPVQQEGVQTNPNTTDARPTCQLPLIRSNRLASAAHILPHRRRGHILIGRALVIAKSGF